MLDKNTRKAIREAFLSGQLHVLTADPRTCEVAPRPVSDVLKHTKPKRMVRLTLEDGRRTDFTEDHSVFLLCEGRLVPTPAGALALGDAIVIVEKSQATTMPIKAIKDLGHGGDTYDLSVPGPENFVLTNGILAHNSYSIGGVSLDLERSSKYEGMRSSAENNFNSTAKDSKQQTVKYFRGLAQPRYGVGIRSSFGPQTARGVLSPRSFL